MGNPSGARTDYRFVLMRVNGRMDWPILDGRCEGKTVQQDGQSVRGARTDYRFVLMRVNGRMDWPILDRRCEGKTVQQDGQSVRREDGLPIRAHACQR